MATQLYRLPTTLASVQWYSHSTLATESHLRSHLDQTNPMESMDKPVPAFKYCYPMFETTELPLLDEGRDNKQVRPKFTQ